MLTADLAMSWRRGRRTGPRTIRADEPQMQRVAADLIALFRQHRGRSRGDLERALEEYVGVDPDYKVLRGLIKLLMDRCLFDTISSVDPAEARRVLFLTARRVHPVVNGGAHRQRVLSDSAHELQCSPENLLQSLYADLPENHILVEFDEPTPQELLDEYNLAQAQALLYRCLEMRIWLEPQPPEGYRRLFDAVKAHRLIHTIRGTADTGYEIRLDGPLSMFHRSQKYGVQMAVFFPALLECDRWRMRAEITHKRGGSAFFELTSAQNRFRLHRPTEAPAQPPVTEKLIEKWPHQGSRWEVAPNHAVIHLGESVFIPDVVFRLKDDPSRRCVYLEILGFWTPRWLRDRVTQLQRAGLKNFLLAASNEWRASRQALIDSSPHIIVFQTALAVSAVQEALELLTIAAGD